MKKGRDSKARKPQKPIVVLEDLEPGRDVQGGSGKVVFGAPPEPSGRPGSADLASVDRSSVDRSSVDKEKRTSRRG